MDTNGSPAASSDLRARFRSRGLRWTPQRRMIVEIVQSTEGHVTGGEIVDRCRARDAETTPSTVYRTLHVLEELGLIRHAHGADGREEFHVRSHGEHGHLYCANCGAGWEIGPEEAAATISSLDSSHGFAVDLSHLTIVGRCAACQREATDQLPAG